MRAVVAALAGGDAHRRARVLRGLPEAVLRSLHEYWPAWAHAGQMTTRDDWSVWLIRAGRGFGKTRAGAEWVQAYARAHVSARIALVGGTIDDVRRVMVEGPSGLIATARDNERWTWRRDRGEFAFAGGAVATVYSAEAPDKLRGPEHDAAWCDELAKWRYGDAAWDNLRMGEDGVAYVLEDASVAGRTPEGWARCVAECAARHGADRVVAEANQGGEMVAAVLRAADGGLPLRLVHASRSKGARAEPVSALYENGRVRHVGMFAGLEDELCGLTPLGYEGPGRSPDRADALVWAVWFLMLGTPPAAPASVRALE